MANYISDSSSIGTLIVSKSFIATASIQFVTNSLHIDYGLGQGGKVGFSSFKSSASSGILINSHVEGNNNTGSAYETHVEGENNWIAIPTIGYTHVEGSGSILLGGSYSHVEGFKNNIGLNGKFVHIEGVNNSGLSILAHVEGYNNTSSNNAGVGRGHYEGENNSNLAGYKGYGHWEGSNNVVGSYGSGDSPHIEGLGNKLDGFHANNVARHIEGSGSTISNLSSNTPILDGHVEGGAHSILDQTTRISAVHIEGYQNSASAVSITNVATTSEPTYGAHVEGIGNSLIGGGRGSHIGGKDSSIIPPQYTWIVNTVPSSSYPIINSFGLNLKTYNTASGYINMFGQYNSSLKIGNSWVGYSYVIIGGGTSDSNRSNIIEIINSQSSTLNASTPTTSYIVLPGLKAYSTNAAAIAAGVPVGGLYIGKKSGDTDVNTLFIAY